MKKPAIDMDDGLEDSYEAYADFFVDETSLLNDFFIVVIDCILKNDVLLSRNCR